MKPTRISFVLGAAAIAGLSASLFAWAMQGPFAQDASGPLAITSDDPTEQSKTPVDDAVIADIVQLRKSTNANPIENDPAFAPIERDGQNVIEPTTSEQSASDESNDFAGALAETIKSFPPSTGGSSHGSFEPHGSEKVSSLRGAAMLLDQAAQMLEAAEVYQEADAVRQSAGQLRGEARRLRGHAD